LNLKIIDEKECTTLGERAIAYLDFPGSMILDVVLLAVTIPLQELDSLISLFREKRSHRFFERERFAKADKMSARATCRGRFAPRW
jgi:hypothetical protein